MPDAAPVPRPPDALLRPLLDSAADVLRTMKPDAVPSSLRALAGFDRKGLASTAARQQLQRAIDTDTSFREAVHEHFLARPEVASALADWTVDEAAAIALDTARRGDLALLASALFSAQPDGWEFGLGAAGAVFERQRFEQEEDADAKAQTVQLAAAEETRRRAEDARVAADARSAALEAELRTERQQRRARQTAAEEAAATAEQRAVAAEESLVVLRSAHAELEARLERQSERARQDQEALKGLRAQLEASEHGRRDAETKLIGAPAGAALRRTDLQALTEAAELARRLAEGLGGVAEHAASLLPEVAAPPGPSAPPVAPAAPPARPAPEAPAKRVRAPVPPGLLEDSPEGLVAMLQYPNTALVIDGYNLSMAAWGDARPAVQRWRLVAGLTALHARYRCDITVVFDGADVEGVQAPRRAGVRVLFSPADEEADTVVVKQAAARPLEVPVVVVSSDGWVRTHAAEEGARIVSSESLARILA
jgi:predicted RNA-binding protein with PIN domain